MEKIQSAIAKARAARDSQQDPAAAEAPKNVAPHPRPVSQDRLAVQQTWAGLPVFSPEEAVLKRNLIVTYSGEPGARDFDVLRTRILQQMRANNWRRLAITSPGPGSGKSTLALNLAFSLARQPDQRTILAEVDMRRPSLAKTLGLRRAQRFDKVLSGEETFSDQAVRVGDHLAIITNERPVHGAAELLQSDATGYALDQIQEIFNPTIMLFDMPPMAVSDDAMAFLGYVDCVILLGAAGQTTVKQIDACERDIATQTNVMGVVLNKCRYLEDNEDYYDY
jgi:Mrp family chromosome partitioning ATPase